MPTVSFLSSADSPRPPVVRLQVYPDGFRGPSDRLPTLPVPRLSVCRCIRTVSAAHLIVCRLSPSPGCPSAGVSGRFPRPI